MVKRPFLIIQSLINKQFAGVSWAFNQIIWGCDPVLMLCETYRMRFILLFFFLLFYFILDIHAVWWTLLYYLHSAIKDLGNWFFFPWTPSPYHTHIITLETHPRDSLLRYDSILWASNTEHSHVRFYMSPTISVTLFPVARRSLRWIHLVVLLALPLHGKEGLLRGSGLFLEVEQKSISEGEARGSPSVHLALCWQLADICTLESGHIHKAYAQRDPVSSKSSHHPLFKFCTQPGGRRLDFRGPLIAGPRLSGHRCECSTGGDDPSSCGNQCCVLWVCVKSFTWSGHLGAHGQLECPVLHSCKFLCSSFPEPRYSRLWTSHRQAKG